MDRLKCAIFSIRLILLVFITSLIGTFSSNVPQIVFALATIDEQQQQQHSIQEDFFQPSLIGFRCEGAQDMTADGVTIVEANTPVKFTLFGEAFTRNTIVAFTTELSRKTQQRETDILDQVVVANQAGVRDQVSFNNLSTQLVQVDGGADDLRRRRKYSRRLLSRASHDCTDFDRVISYKLTDANIITPNVAQITVKLPELELDSSAQMYYHFCLKQPAHLYTITTGVVGNSSESIRREANELQQYQQVMHRQSANGTTSTNMVGLDLVWVHQGDEWWLSVKVEPPILSVTNDCVLIALLLFLSAVTSGLNLGLMSLDMNELAVISSCGDHRERSYARTIAPLRKRGNYLLCSLLLGNVMVNSTLTVILEEMTSGLIAVIGSTLAIVILGEIVPQAFCARQGLAIGAKTIYLTYAFMIITFPLSYPISCLLDCVLGEEKGNVYDRERLMEFIRITGNHTQLEADEVAIISGALKLKRIKVDQIMTKIEDVFMLPIDCMLDRNTIKSIIEKGYSRIPVYEFNDRKQIVALILAKDLALLDPDDQMPLANMLMYCKHPLIFIEDSATLDVALNEFKTGKSHMAIVRQIYDDGEVDRYYEAIGVVTLEDVIEEVLQTEINDETDTLSDNRRKRRRTDAQVAHLVDELATPMSATTPAPCTPTSLLKQNINLSTKF